MQAALSTLPEFNAYGPHQYASPMFRTWDLLSFETFAPSCKPFFHRLTIFHSAALITTPSTDPAGARTRCEVCITLFRRQLHSLAFHTHLPLQYRPEKSERCPGITFQVHRLSAVVVGVEHESACVSLAQ